MARFRKTWKADTWEYYDEGGRAIGKLLAYEPHREPEIWKLVSGTGIWKRWYLKCFAAWWRIENPREYNTMKAIRSAKKLSRLRRAAKLKAERDSSIRDIIEKTDADQQNE